MGWSSGCRKEGTTPAFAASTAQLAFSMNQAARRKATGTDTVRRPSSVILELFSRLYSATWAPTVDRKTIFAGCVVGDGGLDRRDCFVRKRKAGFGVEVWRRHEEHAFDTGKRAGQTNRFRDRGDCDLAALLSPRTA